MAYCVVAALLAWPRRRWVPGLVASLFSLLLLTHQARSINTTYAVEWKPSGELRRMLDIVATDHLPLIPQRPVVTLCAGFESWGAVPYYTLTRGSHWLVLDKQEGSERFVPSDYYIVEYNAQDQVDTAHWELLYASGITGTSLYRDERLRHTAPLMVFHARRDMEARTLPGRNTEEHVSGAQSIRFDGQVRATDPLDWTVPEGWNGAAVQVVGTSMVLQPDDRNWIACTLTLKRNGQEIERRVTGSVPQTAHFGEWNPISVSMRPATMLRPGDVVDLSIWPQNSLTPLYVDDMELWVTQ
jgi:hypothetical protein